MTTEPFPFNRSDYSLCYSDNFEKRNNTSCPVFIRKIPGKELMDGRLPWPYVKLNSEDHNNFYDQYQDLITIVGVTRPSPRPPWSGSDIIQHKNHFIINPALSRKPLSRKSLSNLRKGERIWKPLTVNPEKDIDVFITLHRDVILRRALIGSAFDHPISHFIKLFQLPQIQVFGVAKGAVWGAMACGLNFNHELHLLHIVTGNTGITSCASYALMNHITEYSHQNNIMVFMGGAPEGDNGGLLRFKVRWSNHSLPTWLLRMVIEQKRYYQLSIPGNRFFPAYRTTWLS
ncbi:MAG: hypothetical protein GX654_11985 [Desulfatiglans sp.]|nr:hypothetical protein [Desulfatiglans sp.]